MTTRRAARLRRSIPQVVAALFLTTVVGAVLEGTASRPQEAGVAREKAETYEDIYNGWKWWHVYCYRCHGQDAMGATTAPNLTDPNGRLTPAEFLRIVRDGTPDTAMQAWNQLLDEEQIGQIHLYVRARTDRVLPPGRPDEVGPNGGPWIPPEDWPAP